MGQVLCADDRGRRGASIAHWSGGRRAAGLTRRRAGVRLSRRDVEDELARSNLRILAQRVPPVSGGSVQSVDQRGLRALPDRRGGISLPAAAAAPDQAVPRRSAALAAGAFQTKAGDATSDVRAARRAQNN